MGGYYMHPDDRSLPATHAASTVGASEGTETEA